MSSENVSKLKISVKNNEIVVVEDYRTSMGLLVPAMSILYITNEDMPSFEKGYYKWTFISSESCGQFITTKHDFEVVR